MKTRIFIRSLKRPRDRTFTAMYFYIVSTSRFSKARTISACVDELYLTQ
jgi:hypothetical protein